MKRFFLIIVTLILVLSSYVAEAKEEVEFCELTKYGIIQTDDNLNEYVSRYECVVMILKLCGLSHEKSIEYSLEELYQPLFSDESENGIISGYLRFAKYNGIAYGVDEQSFEPNRNATYVEAVAFAMRINGNKKCDRDSDLDILYDEAYELQIIDETMYNKKNDDIIYSDWCKILMNTMNSKCVVDTGTGLDYENMTYRDILIEMSDSIN